MTANKGGKDDDAKRSRKEVTRRLKAEAFSEASLLITGSFAMIASSLSIQALPRLMGRLIDQKSTNRAGKVTSNDLTWVVLGGGLASLVRTMQLNTAESRIAARLRTQAFSALMRAKDLQWFQNASIDPDSNVNDEQKGLSAGALGDVLKEDVAKVASALTSAIANLLRSTSSVLFSTYHMLSLNPSLFGVAFTVVPAVGSAAVLLRKAIQRTTEEKRRIGTQLSTFTEERLTNIAMVKMSNREADEISKYTALQDQELSVARTSALQSGMFMSFLFVASSSALLLVVNVGGKSVAAGRMTSGELTSFATYSFMLGLGTSGIMKAAGEYLQGMVSARRLFQVIYQASVKNESENAPTVSVAVPAVQSIRLDNVSFSYDSSPKPVLKDLSLELSRGRVVALVGKNGSGKSTTASLLAGLLKASAGRIVLSNGVDWQAVDKATKSQLVQVVLQSTALFNTTIEENIRYSNPSASASEIEHVLELTNCTDLIAKLDGGLNFVVGVNGSKLSGGERQRLALARALLADPAILIMDEPLSGLDADGASAVAEAIETCRQSNRQRALLLITHQPKSLALADEVIVLKGGRVVETGTFKELQLNKSGELRELMPSI